MKEDISQVSFKSNVREFCSFPSTFKAIITLYTYSTDDYHLVVEDIQN